MTKANTATNARPVLDSRAKTPTLAQSAAAAKGLKPETSQTKPPKADKPAKPTKDEAAITKAKAEAAAKKEADKAAITKAKAEAAAKKAAEKEAANKAKAEAAAEKKAKAEQAKAEKQAAKKQAAAERAEAREAARQARIEAGLGDRLVPADLSHYVVNKEVKTAGGHASVNCGDATATKLMGKTIDEIYTEAAKVLGEPETDLRKKYAHLNVGMQRMNLGNRMRAASAKQESKKADAPAKPAKATPAAKK